MTGLNPFHFHDESSQFTDTTALVGVLPDNIAKKESLLEALAEQLDFPAYFGGNWDALFDCLRDFHWISQRKVVLVHHSVPTLPESELKIYLNILRDSALDWRPNENHQFLVVFPASEEMRVRALLA